MSTKQVASWCSSIRWTCLVHDVVHSSRSCQDPYGFCPWDPQEERILSVCCSNFDFHVSHVVNDEEDTLLSPILHNRRKNISLVQYQSNSFSQWELFLVKSRQVLFSVVLLWPLIGMQNLSQPISKHINWTELLRFFSHCCSNSWPICQSHEKF